MWLLAAAATGQLLYGSFDLGDRGSSYDTMSYRLRGGATTNSLGHMGRGTFVSASYDRCYGTGNMAFSAIEILWIKPY